MQAMKLPAITDEVEPRAASLLQSHRDQLYRRTDRLFAGLMAVQWLASLIAAYWVAPRTWEGMSSQTHPHVWIALFLGGVITLYPIMLALLAPGQVITRHVIAIGQLLMSGLLIHLTGGRTETHFHIFGSLAFLAFYRDWRVLVTASLVTAVDHSLRGYFWPQSLYGDAVVEPWRWVEHVGWVVFTDIFLILSIAQSGREMTDIAWRQARQEATEASLEQAREHLEGRVQERTAELIHVNAALEHDIIKRQETEKSLQKERDFISAIVDTAGSLVVVLDRQGTVVQFNRACEQTTGYSFEEIRGKKILDFVLVPDEAPGVRVVIEQIYSGHYPNTYENNWVTKSGSLRRIAWSNTALVDAQGAVEYIVGTGIDITERKRLEEEHNQELAEALERANRDPLTNLLNHRAFHSLLDREVNRAERTGTSLAVAVLDLDNFKFFNDCYGHAVGDEVLRTVAATLQSIFRPEDIIARFGGDEFALILPGSGHTLSTEVEARLRVGLGDMTFVSEGMETAIPITASVGAAVFPNGSQNRLELLRQADERLLLAKTGSEAAAAAMQVRTSVLQRVQGFSMLDALVTAVDNKDRYTRRHSEDVMTYSVQIAQELGMDKKVQHTVAVAALIHDVGKIGVPDAILRKPGKLTNDEFEAIRQHPQMGAIMAEAVPGLECMLDAIRHHHERWDGGGYPFGLAGEETPLIARLMAVADAFSAMTTDRPYRKGMDTQKALSILDAGAGTQWDAVCVKAFLRAQHRGTGQSLLQGAFA